VIPRWGLTDRVEPAEAQGAPRRGAPSAELIQAMLLAAMLALGGAALAHIARYVLLVINRDTLLHPLVAGAGLWLPILAGVAAVAATAGYVVVLTRWLIARRAAAFAHAGGSDSRRSWALWLGCLAPPSCALAVARIEAVLLSTLGHRPSWWLMAVAVTSCLLPLLGLVWALVYVVELAKTEGHYPRLRKPIWVWWLLVLVSCATSVFATLTSFARDAQGIANNTVVTTLAYLLTLAAVAGAARVFEGFQRRPVDRPAHRWVMVADDQPAAPAAKPPTADESLESQRQEAAA
jgi:hypothetical protein